MPNIFRYLLPILAIVLLVVSIIPLKLINFTEHEHQKKANFTVTQSIHLADYEISINCEFQAFFALIFCFVISSQHFNVAKTAKYYEMIKRDGTGQISLMESGWDCTMG